MLGEGMEWLVEYGQGQVNLIMIQILWGVQQEYRSELWEYKGFGIVWACVSWASHGAYVAIRTGIGNAHDAM